MSRNELPRGSEIRYQPNDKPPATLLFGLGLQLTALTVVLPIVIPTVVMRSAGASDAYLSWAVFASVCICGATTAMQALRFNRIGSGHAMVMSSSVAFIWLCIEAMQTGGPALLATLVTISAFLQFVLSAHIALVRRVLTATVSGTVLMLVPVTAMPIVLDMLANTSNRGPEYAVPLSAAATVFVLVCIALKGTWTLRLWTPVIGVLAGSVVAAALGLYDVERVAEAQWFGVPDMRWPGLSLEFGPAFWSLIPAFLLVTLIVTLRSISSCVAVQSVSWQPKRAVDFRAVQGAMNVDGISNLLSGLAGTVPNSALSVSASLTEITGVSARGVGIATGAVFVLLAMSPKVLAIFLAIPSSVVAGYLTVLMSLLFMAGIRILLEGGIDYRKALIVGVSFWMGVGFQNGAVFPEVASKLGGGLLSNGLTSGGLTAILLTLFLEFTSSRRIRMEAEPALSALPKIREFLRSFASRNGWDDEVLARLDAVAEEALLNIVDDSEQSQEQSTGLRHLCLEVHRKDDTAVLEFSVAPTKGNIQDRLALLEHRTDKISSQHELSLRILGHLASSVRHQKYHDIEVLSVEVKTHRGEDAR